jgi:hypothetical protein
MRIHSISIFAAALLLAAALPAAAQAPKPAPASAPAKPYKAVAIKPAQPAADASLDAFRKQLGEAAQKKDRAALAKLVVAQGFFWDRENGNAADKKKSGADNLAVTLGLKNKEAAGWDMLGGYATDPTASPSPDHKGAMCAPADPAFNEKDFENLMKSTQTDLSDWGYLLTDGVDVRTTPQANAPVMEKLGLHFVRVAPEGGPASYLRIITPSGKAGFITADSVAPLGNDQICYVKDGGGWKIGGYIGGGDAQ